MSSCYSGFSILSFMRVNLEEQRMLETIPRERKRNDQLLWETLAARNSPYQLDDFVGISSFSDTVVDAAINAANGLA